MKNSQVVLMYGQAWEAGTSSWRPALKACAQAALAAVMAQVRFQGKQRLTTIEELWFRGIHWLWL